MKHTQSNVAMRVSAATDESTIKVAHRTSHILAKITEQLCSAHNIEEDSFDLSLDGERYAGGSYYIDSKGNLVLASVTPHKVLGHVTDVKSIEANLR